MKTDFLIIGAGPAGLSSAITTGKYGVRTLIVDDGIKPGGQLTKQTHKFLGSYKQYASIRGIEIARNFISQIDELDNITLMPQTTLIGAYNLNKWVAVKEDKTFVIEPEKVLVATGASERMIPFLNNDLPGVYGAGAVQTMMNLYGVIPGNRILMVGAGNIGLIVSYQLMQAGCQIASVVEAASSIGGYWVHSAKILRMGIPILTNTTIVKALGKKRVTGAIIADVDNSFKPVESSYREIECDTICLAVGLIPLTDLLFQIGCQMKFIPELCGDVPLRDDRLETSVKGVFVAGDVSGIEEATSAILEGELAGLHIAKELGKKVENYESRISDIHDSLEQLRSGETAVKIHRGLEKLKGINES